MELEPKWLRERGVGDGGAGGGGEALGVWRQAGVALAVTGGRLWGVGRAVWVRIRRPLRGQGT